MEREGWKELGRVDGERGMEKKTDKINENSRREDGERKDGLHTLLECLWSGQKELSV